MMDTRHGGARRRGRVTVLFVEHDMDIVQRATPSRVVAFYAGRIIADGAPATVLADRRRAPLRHRERAHEAPMLAVEVAARRDRLGAGAARLLARGAGGRHGRPRRPQRRRQDDADAHPHGPPRADAAAAVELRRPGPRRACRRTRAPRLGIGYMPEDRGLVPELTVEENILVPVWVSKTLDDDGAAATSSTTLMPELAGDARAARAAPLAAASRSWSRSPARSPPARACSCSTSRSRASRRRCPSASPR